MVSVVPTVAESLGLVPLLWLAYHRDRRPVWWWIAAAFAVSWVADVAARFVDPWLPAAVYPVSQAGLVVVALARREAPVYVGMLMLAGLIAVAWEGVTGPTLFLDIVAAGVVVSVVWDRPSALRGPLLVAFGGGLLAWIVYLFAPSLLTWGLYQTSRALGIGMFCWASLKPHPMLRVIA